MNKKEGINDKQKAFCREFLVDNNATKALVRAGYSPKGASVAASRMLAKAHVKAYLSSLRGELISDRQRIINDNIAFWVKMRDTEEKENEDGSTRRVFDGDRLKASELLGKTLGMFTEKMEVDNTVTFIHTYDIEGV
jgi:phage terminase small subunit